MADGNACKTIYVAGAGTGKTSLLRDIAIARCADQRVLYLTYTNANAAEFTRSIVEQVGHVPEQIKIMTWLSFLLTHGVRPFPAKGFTHRIDSMFFNSNEPHGMSGVRRGSERYYCPSPGTAYRTRLADLTALCDEQWGGEVIRRVCAIYGVVLVDEAQDFAGYDYDLLLSLMNVSHEMVIVGDPRQQTYRTGAKAKNRNYPNVFSFFESKTDYLIDSTTLSVSHRCSNEVISLANRLYSEYPAVTASEVRSKNPKGQICEISRRDFEDWDPTERARLTTLIWDKRTKVPSGCRVMNMGESKGLTLGDVVIFPTRDMKKWLSDPTTRLESGTKAKFYVAITRAAGDLFFVL